MWIIIKYKKNELSLLTTELKKKIGKDCKIYLPKFCIQEIRKKKLINYEVNLLNDYMFCFHPKLELKKNLNELKFIRGLKYVLDNFKNSQKEIKEFINKCKEFENEKGYLSKNFLEMEIFKSYKFTSGPFTDTIFKIISLNKNKIKVLIGDIKTTINKGNYLYSSI